jgi:hypothetical protein
MQDGAVVGVEKGRDIARKAAEIALMIVVAAALAAVWLALFVLLPLDIGALRPH